MTGAHLVPTKPAENSDMLRINFPLVVRPPIAMTTATAKWEPWLALLASSATDWRTSVPLSWEVKPRNPIPYHPRICMVYSPTWGFPKMVVPNHHWFSYSKWRFWGVLLRKHPRHEWLIFMVGCREIIPLPWIDDIVSILTTNKKIGEKVGLDWKKWDSLSRSRLKTSGFTY